MHGGHESFMVGLDMSYFSEDIMDLLAKFNPLSVLKDENNL